MEDRELEDAAAIVRLWDLFMFLCMREKCDNMDEHVVYSVLLSLEFGVCEPNRFYSLLLNRWRVDEGRYRMLDFFRKVVCTKLYHSSCISILDKSYKQKA